MLMTKSYDQYKKAQSGLAKQLQARLGIKPNGEPGARQRKILQELFDCDFCDLKIKFDPNDLKLDLTYKTDHPGYRHKGYEIVDWLRESRGDFVKNIQDEGTIRNDVSDRYETTVTAAIDLRDKEVFSRIAEFYAEPRVRQYIADVRGSKATEYYPGPPPTEKQVEAYRKRVIDSVLGAFSASPGRAK